VKCLPGFFAVNNTLCQLCNEGTKQPLAGQTSCESCPAGSYINQKGQGVCKVCEGGTYGDVVGMTSCLPCAAGSSRLQTGQASDATACKLCDPGTYSPSRGFVQCLSCPVGKATNLPGSLNCSDCEPVARCFLCLWPCELSS
jgi:hypothetical protein